MKSKLQIGEQDIFNYVFYPHYLEAGKKNYIDANLALFKNEIEFCNALKTGGAKNITSDYDNSDVKNSIILFPVKTDKKHNSNFLTLAAASAELSKKIETKTFTDLNSRYLARLVSVSGNKTLYVFQKDGLMKEIKLTLFPSLKSYKINSSESSIEMDSFEEIEKISIED